MAAPQNPTAVVKRIRLWLAIFIAGLVLSGATAIPLQTEMDAVAPFVNRPGFAESSGVSAWIRKIQTALVETNARYPFLAYGDDWLAFGHFMIAISFIGPWRNPVKNIWVIEFGMIACVLIVPYALFMGGVRGIPWGWRLVDCSFGAGGMIPLLLCWRKIKQLEVTVHSAVTM